MILPAQPLPPCPRPGLADTIIVLALIAAPPAGMLAFRRWRTSHGAARTALFVFYVLCALLVVDACAIGLIILLTPPPPPTCRS